MTADSTSRLSHFHGARSVPATMAAAGSTSAATSRPSAAGSASGSASGECSERTPKTSSSDATNVSVGLHSTGIERGHLCEREVFRKAPGGKILDRATEHGQKRTTAGMWATCPTVEVRGDTRTCQRVLEHADVLLGRTNQHRHLVEPNTVRRFFQNAARDFNALPPFARRRKPDELPGSLSLGQEARWKTGGAQVESGRCRLPARATRSVTERFSICWSDRASPAGRVTSARGARSTRAQRNCVSASDSNGTSSSRTGIGGHPGLWRLQRTCCRFEQRSPVAGVRFTEERLDAFEQLGEIGPAPRQPSE